MGKRGVPSCNWTKLRIGKIKLKIRTLDGSMRVWKLFEGERRLPLPSLYIFIRILDIHTPNLRQLTISLATSYRQLSII